MSLVFINDTGLIACVAGAVVSSARILAIAHSFKHTKKRTQMSVTQATGLTD